MTAKTTSNTKSILIFSLMITGLSLLAACQVEVGLESNRTAAEPSNLAEHTPLGESTDAPVQPPTAAPTETQMLIPSPTDEPTVEAVDVIEEINEETLDPIPEEADSDESDGINVPQPSIPEINLPQIAIPSPNLAGEPVETLNASWLIDSDGDGVPDGVELEVGTDPLVDQCSPSACTQAELNAAPLEVEPIDNLLILFDASGSMQDLIDGKPRIEVAREAINQQVIAAEGETNYGLAVFGHLGDDTEAGKAASCDGIELFSPVGALTAENVTATLSSFDPNGWTPLAGALTLAEEAFSGVRSQNNHVLLVTDGIETCGGDPALVAGRMHTDPDLNLTVHVVGLGISNLEEVPLLVEIAEAGGGSYFGLREAEALSSALSVVVQNAVAQIGRAACVGTTLTGANACYATQYLAANNHLLFFEMGHDLSDAAQFQLDTIREEMFFTREKKLAELEELVGGE